MRFKNNSTEAKQVPIPVSQGVPPNWIVIQPGEEVDIEERIGVGNGLTSLEVKAEESTIHETKIETKRKKR